MRARRRGRKPNPLARLTPDCLREIDAARASRDQLREIGGWPSQPHFSTLLYAPFPLTKLTTARLERLAAALGLAADRVYEVVR